MCMSLKYKQKRFIPVVVVDVAVPPKVAVAAVVRFYSLPPSIIIACHVFCQSLHSKCDIYAVPYQSLQLSFVSQWRCELRESQWLAHTAQ